MPSAQPEVQPHLVVVFGATGDLAHRKILPALHRLFEQGKFTAGSVVLGAALQADLNDASFRDLARKTLGAADAFLDRIFYCSVGRGEAADYQALAARIVALEREHQLPGNRIFYLALPPQAFAPTITRLGEAGLNRGPGSTRLVIEKPFGRDLASAQELNRVLHIHFEESQIYRIDHYLGKETVQNLLVFRFANGLFESVWTRDRIRHVEITVAETLGVEHRAAYYEGAGALRDMVQNHLTQILTSTAMELPSAFDANSIRYEKTKLLRAIAPIRPEDVAFGQYTPGSIGGENVPGYREEEGVAPDSSTETFVAIKLAIDNPRWNGVPFYLHSGKRLPKQFSQIAITFDQPPGAIFEPHDVGSVRPNKLIVALQPDEGFDLHFEVKCPGQAICLDPQSLSFRYAQAFAPLPEAYETLLLDVMLGDQTLFVSDDWVEASWRLYTPLLAGPKTVLPYAAGTWGPAGLEHLSWPPEVTNLNPSRK